MSGCFGAGGGVFGFDPAHGTYVHSGDGTTLAGFAITADGRQAYEASSAGSLDCRDVDASPCELTLSGPLAFKPAGSQARQP